MGLGRVVRRPERANKPAKPGTMRLPSGRLIYLDRLRLFALIQADDFSQWIAAEIKTMTRHEAVCLFNQYYGYATHEGQLCGYVLQGNERDRYLSVYELGGLDLPFVKAMEPYKVREVRGLYEWE